MHMREYVKSWLVGVGRSDRDELPELLTPESRDMFARFQRKEASPNDYLREILGIDVVPTHGQDETPKPGR